MLEYQYKPLAKDIAYRILRVSLQKSENNEYMFTMTDYNKYKVIPVDLDKHMLEAILEEISTTYRNEVVCLFYSVENVNNFWFHITFSENCTAEDLRNARY